MKKSLYFISTIFLFIAMSGAVVNAAVAKKDSIQWVEYSADIFKKPNVNTKLVLIFAMTDTCHWCAEMEKVTFTTPDVIKQITDNYYPVMLHADIDSTAAEKYQISGVPMIIITEPDGKVIETYEGYSKPEDLMKNLSAAQKKVSVK